MSIVYSLVDPLFGVSYSFQWGYIPCVFGFYWNVALKIYQYSKNCHDSHFSSLLPSEIVMTISVVASDDKVVNMARTILWWSNKYDLTFYHQCNGILHQVSMIQGWHHILCKHIATNSASANFASHKIRLTTMTTILLVTRHIEKIEYRQTSNISRT